MKQKENLPNKNNNYIYKGNFSFDKYDGYGIYRDLSANVIYDGYYKDILMHGKGKLSFKIGNEYEGDLMCGLMEGYGVYYQWGEKNRIFYNGKYNDIKIKLYE